MMETAAIFVGYIIFNESMINFDEENRRVTCGVSREKERM